MLKKVLDIFSVFFKIGVIGFGGGSALIPVIEKEIVENKKWFTEEEYLKHTVIANITPGTLPTKIGAVAGYEIAGGWGSLAGAYAATLPGVLLTMILMMLFTIAGAKITHYIEFASVGITIFIINLLGIYILKVISSGKQNNLYRANIIICVLAFLVTGGKEIRQIIGAVASQTVISMDNIMFDIPTINLIIIAFFMIFFVGLLKTKWAFITGTLISLAYAIVLGKNGLIPNSELVGQVILILMVGLAGYAMLSTRKEGDAPKVSFKFTKQMGLAIGLFVGLPVVLIIVAIILAAEGPGVVGQMLGYSKDVTVSTLTSFGGGEAYVAVADGFFVQTGMVEAGEFYNKLVAVANALPGPILVKIAAGVGYIFGGTIGGMVYGWLLGMLGMTLAVGSCCILALVVLMGYDALKGSEALKLLKQYILPVVCGMLISTSLSMMVEAMKVTSVVGLSGGVALPIMLLSIVGVYIIHKKYHVNDVILLIGCAIISFIGLSLF